MKQLDEEEQAEVAAEWASAYPNGEGVPPVKVTRVIAYDMDQYLSSLGMVDVGQVRYSGSDVIPAG